MIFLGNFKLAKTNILTNGEEIASGANSVDRKKIIDYFAFFLGESQVARAILTGTNWWLVCLILGFTSAVIHLIMTGNPSICYLLAESRIQGFEVTLPEAMAQVQAWGWFNLALYPLQYALGLAAIAWLFRRAGLGLKGAGDFGKYFGLVTGGALIISLGQFTGYLIVNAQDLKNLSDLRDLTPGVGLGLLPLLAIEQIGPFWREVVRGFDLFGIWAILFMAGTLKSFEGFSRIKSFWLGGLFYALFIACRWLLEGPVSRLWQYFWNYGKI